MSLKMFMKISVSLFIGNPPILISCILNWKNWKILTNLDNWDILTFLPKSHLYELSVNWDIRQVGQIFSGPWESHLTGVYCIVISDLEVISWMCFCCCWLKFYQSLMGYKAPKIELQNKRPKENSEGHVTPYANFRHFFVNPTLPDVLFEWPRTFVVIMTFFLTKLVFQRSTVHSCIENIATPKAFINFPVKY